MTKKPNKRDYECRICGCVLTDEEVEENNCVCNVCLIDNLECEEDYYSWEEYK